MRRATSLERSIDLLVATPSLRSTSSSLCCACLARRVAARHPPSPTTAFSTSARHRASDGPESSFTERWRRRIWGTDKPPGPADPYKRVRATEIDVPRTEQEQEPREEAASQQEGEEALQQEGEESLPQETGPMTKAQKREERLAAEAKRDEETLYQPALTWDGLQSVGERWEEIRERLAPSDEFRGFLPSTRITSPPEVTLSLYRALVETYTLVHESIPISRLYKVSPNAGPTHQTSSVRIKVLSGSSTPVLEYPSDDVRQEILASLQPSKSVPEERRIEEDIEVPGAKPTPLAQKAEPNLEDEVAKLGHPWLSISLQDPAIKFAVLKRTAQLTGILIPDPSLPYIRTADSLLHTLLGIVAPKAQTTYDALVANEELRALANVKIVGRRVTPVDREREVGRWKGIVRELERRELPVLGHKGLE